MLQTFRKQNLNFVEILFTQYKWEHPLYQEEWQRLVREREAIARYCPYQAVKTMKGIAMEKYHAMEHKYPSKVEVLAKYGYDPKQLHHLLRVEEYLHRYIDGESYEKCLRPRDPDFLKSVKQGYFTLDQARVVASAAINDILNTTEDYCSKASKEVDPNVDELLDDVQRNIMKTAMLEELLGDLDI